MKKKPNNNKIKKYCLIMQMSSNYANPPLKFEIEVYLDSYVCFVANLLSINLNQWNKTKKKPTRRINPEKKLKLMNWST